MKKVFSLLCTLLLSLLINAQDITGQWNGSIKIQGMQLRLIFNVTQTEDGYNTTMDVPDQGAKEVPITSTIFEDPNITFEAPHMRFSYKGELKDGAITGILKQNGQETELNLSRKAIEKVATRRPQEPSKPYPYYSEEVTFTNSKESITLAGTLTLPAKEGKYPVVVMISGSGPQNRDGAMMGHKPFLVIADYLTKNGIGVLRFDERGIAESTGEFSTATSEDFANDVLSALNYLKTRQDIAENQIGLVGHSEGGLIASIAASKSKDVDFMVSLAGMAVSGYDIILLQTELIGKANGKNESQLQAELEILRGSLDLVIQGKDMDSIQSELKGFLEEELTAHPEVLPEGVTQDEYIASYVGRLATPWLKYLITFDPASALNKVKCPVLAINGEKDLQVPSEINLNAIEKNLLDGGNKNITVKEMPGLNHLLQECTTGSPSEYAKIEQTISPLVLSEMSDWILKQL